MDQRDPKSSSPPPQTPDTADTLPASRTDLAGASTLALDTNPDAPPGSFVPAEKTHASPEERYVIEGEFARGGLGRILKAIDRRLGRPVAVKELLKTRGKAQERFLKEAFLTARLEHPSIVPIHDLGLWQTGEPYYAMKLVDGRSLDQVIQEKKTLKERLSLLPHVIDAAEALAYAHAQKVIHRDVKPQNILLGSFGETVVIDWGIAKEQGMGYGVWGMGTEGRGESAEGEDRREEQGTEEGPQKSFPEHASKEDPNSLRPHTPSPIPHTPPEGLTVAGSVIGTPAYMPPEQAQGKAVDERADVYALGAVLYHLLAGFPPYQGSALEVLRRVSEGDPPPVESAAPGIPPELLAIVKKAMAKDAKDRYPDARALAEELKQFQSGQLVGAYSYSLPDLIRRWVKKHRAIVFAGLLVSLVVLLSVGVSYWNINEALRRAEYSEDQERQAKEDAQTRQQQAEVLNIRLYTERGRLALLAQNPLEAAHYLQRALKLTRDRGGDDTILRILLAQAIHPLDAQLRTLKGHDGAITHAAFSPDGTRVILAGWDKSPRIFDVKTGRLLTTLQGHTELNWWAEFSPEGDKALTASWDQSAKLWDARTGALLRTLPGQVAETKDGQVYSGRVYSARFRKDGSQILTVSGDGIARLWSPSSEVPYAALSLPGEKISEAKFSPDGTRIAAATAKGTLSLWEAASGTLLSSWEAHGVRVMALAFSPDGARLVSAGFDGTARIWDAETGARLHSLSGHEGPITFVELSPKGDRLVTAGADQSARVWDTKTGEAVFVLRAHRGILHTARFSPDGAHILTASDDRTARLFDARTGQLLLSLDGHRARVVDALFHPDGETLLTISWDGTARLWTSKRAKSPLHRLLRSFGGHEGGAMFAGFSQDETSILTTALDGKARLFDARTGALRLAVPDDSALLFGLESSEDATPKLSRDGERLLTTSRDGKIFAWDTRTGALLFERQALRAEGEPHQKKITALAFLPGEERWLTAGGGVVNLWAWEQEAPLLIIQAHTLQAKTRLPGVSSLAIDPTGSRFAATSWNTTARLFDIKTGAVLSSFQAEREFFSVVRFSHDGRYLFFGGFDALARAWDSESEAETLFKGHAAPITALAYNRAGDRLITGGLDGEGRIWSLTQKSFFAPLEGHTDAIHSITLSPDEELILTASEDDTARLWDIESGQLLFVFDGHTGPIHSACFNQDGTQVLTASEDSIVRLWDITPERRSPEEILAILEEKSPFRLAEDGRLFPKEAAP